jgi:hypothetical protein
MVILRGHGIASAATTVEQAVLQAISLDRLARMSLRVRVLTARTPDAGTDGGWLPSTDCCVHTLSASRRAARSGRAR